MIGLSIEIRRKLGIKNSSFAIYHLPSNVGSTEIEKIVKSGDNFVTCLNYLQDENLVIFTKGLENSSGFNIIDIRLTSKAINLIEGLKVQNKESEKATLTIFNIENIKLGELFNLEVSLGVLKSMFGLN